MFIGSQKNMDITLYCLGEKAYISLRGLDGYLIPFIKQIIVGEDRNVMNDYSKEIITWALENKIRYFLKNNAFKKKIPSKFHIAIGWRWIIDVKQDEQLIVFHDSLLPKYRGFNPLVTALLNGDKEIGVSVLFGDKEYDEGKIIKQASIVISYPMKIKYAIQLISNLYAKLLFELILHISKGELLIGQEQNVNLVSYSLWRDNEDYYIDWNRDSDYIERFVNAVGYPYMGACTYCKNKIIRINEVEPYPDMNITNRDVGKSVKKINGRPLIVCGKGLLKINSASWENGEEVEFNNFRIRLYDK